MIEQPSSESTTEKAVRSVKWLAMTEVVSRAISPIVTVILARLLAPEDFGVVATAMIAISFAQMFFDVGLGKALVQTEELSDKAGSVVFWSNVSLGFLVYSLLFFAAPLIADFFRSPDSESVLRVLGIQIVITSMASVQSALIVRGLEFRRLFWIRAATALVPAVFSIPMAFSGYGVWALVAGALIGQTMNLVLLWKASKWRPRFEYDLHIARTLFRFGSWVLIESVAAWLLVWGDTLIVGKLLGLRSLGVYQTGWTLVSVVFGLALNPILSVLFPTFSRMQGDIEGLRMSFHRIDRLIIAVSLPIGVGLFLTGPGLASVLFGDRWEGLGLVLSMLGVSLGLAWPVGINSELYRAIGRPEIGAKLLLVSLAIYLPGYFLAARISLEVFLYVRFGLVFAGIALHSWVFGKTTRESVFYLWHDGRVFILAVACMALGTSLIDLGIGLMTPELSTGLETAITIASGAAIYLLVVSRLDRPFVTQALRLFKRSAIA